MNKYGAIRTVIDGITFHSKGEGQRYLVLKERQRRGVITDLKTQPKFPIVIKGVKVCTVILDFSYKKDGFEVIEDFKGMDNPLSALKRKLVNAEYGIEVKLVHKPTEGFSDVKGEGNEDFFSRTS